MEATDTKYLFVTGGVVSSLGKGLASASIGRLMESSRVSRLFHQARSLYQRRSRAR